MSDAGKFARWARMLGSDHVHTYAAEGAVLVATLVVYRLAAHLGSEGLDGYILARRTLSLAQPVLLLGLAVGLPRMVALTQDAAIRRAYLLAALRITSVLSVTGMVLALLFPAPVAGLLLGSAREGPLVAPLALMALGLCLLTVAYSYIRGTHRTLRANILQTVGTAAMPLLAFAIGRELTDVLLFTGIGWCLVAILFLLPEVLSGPVVLARIERGALLRYGLPRIPGDLAYAALFTLPVLWAAHQEGLAASGRIGLGVTLLNVIGAAFAPISILLLPQAAHAISTGDHFALARRIAILERYTLLFSFAALLLVQAALPWLLDHYLAHVDTTPYLPACRLIFLAAPALAYFVALRSVLDAYHTSPRNAVNILFAAVVAVATLVGVRLLGLGGAWPGLALVIGLFTLALRTRAEVVQVRDALRRKASEGARSMRLLLVIPGDPDGNQMPFARRQGRAMEQQAGTVVAVHYLRERTSLAGLWRERRAFRELSRSFGPDLVHAHYGTITGLFTVVVSSAPVVITFHGSDLNPTPTDGRLRDLMGRLCSQFAAYFAAGIICVSEGLRQRLWWRREEVQVLPMGVDLAVFKPMDKATCRTGLGWGEHERFVLFNANNPALKRMDIAERTIALLIERGIPAKLQLLTGGVGPDRIPALMNACDALLLCSDREGSPTMVKEAMACGLPVVTSDVGDVRDRLRDVRPGAVVAQDANALADALEPVLRAPSRSNGRSLAERNGIDAAVIDRLTHRFLQGLLDR